MDLLDSVSLTILLGAVLVLAGILSSLVALRFGAPLLLVFLILGMLAGESGPGGIKFDDVQVAYTVGSVALALILFDGGLRTRLQTFRSVLWPSLVLATVEGERDRSRAVDPLARLRRQSHRPVGSVRNTSFVRVSRSARNHRSQPSRWYHHSRSIPATFRRR